MSCHEGTGPAERLRVPPWSRCFPPRRKARFDWSASNHRNALYLRIIPPCRLCCHRSWKVRRVSGGRPRDTAGPTDSSLCRIPRFRQRPSTLQTSLSCCSCCHMPSHEDTLPPVLKVDEPASRCCGARRISMFQNRRHRYSTAHRTTLPSSSCCHTPSCARNEPRDWCRVEPPASLHRPPL